MSLKIRSHLLTGPFEIDKTVIRSNQDPAVFVIIEKAGQPWDPVFNFVAAGDSGEAGIRLAEHPERANWEKGRSGKVGVYLISFSRKDPGQQQARALVIEDIAAAMKESGGKIPIQGF
jgi:hypothetical protein